MKFKEFEAETGSAILVLVNKAEFIPLYTTMSPQDMVNRIESVYTSDTWNAMAIIKLTAASGNLKYNKKPRIEVFDIAMSSPEIEFYSRKNL